MYRITCQFTSLSRYDLYDIHLCIILQFISGYDIIFWSILYESHIISHHPLLLVNFTLIKLFLTLSINHIAYTLSETRISTKELDHFASGKGNIIKTI